MKELTKSVFAVALVVVSVKTACQQKQINDLKESTVIMAECISTLQSRELDRLKSQIEPQKFINMDENGEIEFGPISRYNDLTTAEMRRYSMPNRTMCDVLDEMRTCHKTRNYSYLLSLIEEVQVMGNRMEAHIEDMRDVKYIKKKIKGYLKKDDEEAIEAIRSYFE